MSIISDPDIVRILDPVSGVFLLNGTKSVLNGLANENPKFPFMKVTEVDDKFSENKTDIAAATTAFITISVEIAIHCAKAMFSKEPIPAMLIRCNNGRTRSPNAIMLFFAIFRKQNLPFLKCWFQDLYCQERPTTACKTSTEFPNFLRFENVMNEIICLTVQDVLFYKNNILPILKKLKCDRSIVYLVKNWFESKFIDPSEHVIEIFNSSAIPKICLYTNFEYTEIVSCKRKGRTMSSTNIKPNFNVSSIIPNIVCQFKITYPQKTIIQRRYRSKLLGAEKTVKAKIKKILEKLKKAFECTIKMDKHSHKRNVDRFFLLQMQANNMIGHSNLDIDSLVLKYNYCKDLLSIKTIPQKVLEFKKQIKENPGRFNIPDSKTVASVTNHSNNQDKLVQDINDTKTKTIQAQVYSMFSPSTNKEQMEVVNDLKEPYNEVVSHSQDLTFVAESKTVTSLTNHSNNQGLSFDEDKFVPDITDSKTKTIQALVLSRFSPLTNKEQVEVVNALKEPYNEEILKYLFGIPMTRRIMKPLNEIASWKSKDKYLNDEIVNFSMSMLKLRDEKLCNLNKSRLRSHFFSSFFMAKLMDSETNEYNFEYVENWGRTTRAILLNPFEYDKIFCPVNVLNENSHWTLLVMFIQKKIIQYYDPLGNSEFKRYSEGALKYLCDKAGKFDIKGFNEKEWKLIKSDVTKNPHQENGYDCGVFAIMTADFLSEDLPLNFKQKHMPLFRNKICANILRGELKYLFYDEEYVVELEAKVVIEICDKSEGFSDEEIN